jgi:ubiquinone/menaquinone biosynthesis C-methylase UbiE
VNLEEYHAMQRVEREHWFYRGKRDLVRWWIAKLHGPLKSGDVFLDAGAGTGEFVRELREQNPDAKILGVEYVAEAREIGQTINGVKLIAGSILEIPLANESVSVSCALDVLEHVENDKLAFAELVRVTKPGGLIIVNVPAFHALWSDWDVTLGHYRRYTKQMFKPLIAPHLESGSIEIEFLNYINVFAFPLVLGYRTLRKFIPSEARAEDKIPGKFVNGLLYASFVRPATWKWFRAPFGVSLFCVARKKR